MKYSSSSSSIDAMATVSTVDESYNDDLAHAGTEDYQKDTALQSYNYQSDTINSRGGTKIRKRQRIKHDETNADKSNDHKVGSSESEGHTASIPLTEKTPQSQNPIMLLICATGICTCYLYYGIIQERLFSKNSNSEIKECGNTTTFMLVLSSMTNAIVANLWIWLEGKLTSKKGKEKDDGCDDNGSKLGVNHKLFFGCAFCFFAAMTASNESLAHVSYPTAVLAKSSKLIPTMIVGYFIEKKSFLIKEWMSAALITFGIVMFNFSRMSQNHGKGKDGAEDSFYGLSLLIFSLTMDGLLAACQNKLKGQEIDKRDDKKSDKKNQKTKKYRPPKALETMLWTNAYALLFLVPLSLWSGQFFNGIKLMNLQPASTKSKPSLSIRQTIFILNLTAATGQIFIFFTIHFFSSLMCTTITTTRKFMTILLSVWKFGHRFSKLQWISIFMVFGGLYLGIVSKLIGVKKNKVSKKVD